MKIVSIIAFLLLSSCYLGKSYENMSYPYQQYIGYDMDPKREDISSMDNFFRYKRNYELDEIEKKEPPKPTYLPQEQFNIQQYIPPHELEAMNSQSSQFTPENDNQTFLYSEQMQLPQKEQIIPEGKEIYNEFVYDELIPYEERYETRHKVRQNIYQAAPRRYEPINPPPRQFEQVVVPLQEEPEIQQDNGYYPYQIQRIGNNKQFNNLNQYQKEQRFLKQNIRTHLSDFPEVAKKRPYYEKKPYNRKENMSKYDLMEKSYFTPEHEKEPELPKYKYPTAKTKTNDKFIKKLDDNILKSLISNDPYSNSF